MLRRLPASQRPGQPTPTTVSGGGFGLVLKPFKPPSVVAPPTTHPQPARTAKRKRTSYKGACADESDSDSDSGSKKRRKRGEEVKPVVEQVDLRKAFPVFKVKPKDETLHRSFAIPALRDSKTGETKVVPLSHAALGLRVQPTIPPRPLHDPMDQHAIVLFDPTVDGLETSREREEREKKAEEEKRRKEERGPHKSLREILGIKDKEEKKKKVVKIPVVIDPTLAKVLRPHQIEGVKFLYRCTMGLMAENAYGCIMADEMGLGKTLQCIALMWTLLKQSPTPGKPTIEKCIIACPSSLVRNWANELVKWLGKDAVSPLAVDGKGTKEQLITSVRQWIIATGRSVSLPVMIVSYETLRNLTEELGKAPVGLMLCDEGHRLKNSDSLTFRALDTIQCKRRVILSGTPIQNDLSEYFSLLNFANPAYLGAKGDFRKNFEHAILKGRDANATDKQKEDSEAKLKELGGMVSKFIIRRTNDLLSKYLPIKYEHVVFTALSPLQIALYRLFLSSSECQKLLKGKGSQPLKAIGILKKLCNHPDLLDLEADIPGSEKLLPEEYLAQRRDKRAGGVGMEWSGKFVVLERFLERMRAETNDKIVLISNYTQTLDLFEKMCRNKRWGSIRLDGTMTVNKRGKLVERFNDPEGKEFVFLLSSKAGGCGLNLIGANRLILFDPDWNPAADQQALARVWRDGQKKQCFVYRFISTGTLEEQILMRQAYKQSLSACVVDEAEDADRHFSADLLRELFKFHDGTKSHMHDTFKCKRCRGGKQAVKAPALLYGDVSTWNHFSNECLAKNHDDLLRAEYGRPEVTQVFQYISH